MSVTIRSKGPDLCQTLDQLGTARCANDLGAQVREALRHDAEQVEIVVRNEHVCVGQHRLLISAAPADRAWRFRERSQEDHYTQAWCRSHSRA
jgi:hypothetical protein